MKVTILKDAVRNLKPYTVLLFNDLPPKEAYDLPQRVSWQELDLVPEETFDLNVKEQFCLGFPKSVLDYRIHFKNKYGSIVTSFNMSMLFLKPENWYVSADSHRDSLGYLYVLPSSCFKFLIDQEEQKEDQGYTQGYKDGCTGLKWL